MAGYSVSRVFEFCRPRSRKALQVMRMFGVNSCQIAERAVEHRCEIDVRPGQIAYLTGPSGAGKSVLLRELEKAILPDERVNLDEIELCGDRTAVDCVEGDFLESLRLLSTVGLNDVYCMLNRPAFMSEGQRYRFRLAVALSMKRRFIFADEFCTNLDRVTAAVIS